MDLEAQLKDKEAQIEELKKNIRTAQEQFKTAEQQLIWFQGEANMLKNLIEQSQVPTVPDTGTDETPEE